MKLHAFNAKKEYQKLMFKRNKGKYIKYGTIILSVCLLVFAIIYFSFSKFSTTKKFNVINSKVGDFSSGDLKTITYVNGTKVEDIPTNDGTYRLYKIDCNNDATATWNWSNWSLSVSNLKKTNTTCNLYFNKFIAFSYTGAVQTYTITDNGYYLFEAWGASAGGTGAYVSGKILLKTGDSFFVYVGQSPAYGVVESFNGSTGTGGGGSGAGATDFRLVGGTWNDEGSLKSRIMVAAGGALVSSAGGALHGIDGNGGTGGTQISSGVEKDGSLYNSSGFGFSYGGCAGGGGYYGGAGCLCNYSGGGGSSYISGYIGCVAIVSSSSLVPRNDANGTQCSEASAASDITCSYHYSGMIFTDTQMISGNSSMPSQDGLTKISGNSGNGYAKITFLGTSIN